MWRSVFLAIYLALVGARIAFGAEASDVVMLPTLTIEADRFVFSLSWRCKWPSQKSKISRAWFNDVPSGGVVESAGIRTDDRLLQYDGVLLSEKTGDWLSERLKQPWKHGEVHELLVERSGKKLKITVEFKKPKKTPEPTPSAPTSPAAPNKMVDSTSETAPGNSGGSSAN